MTAAVCDESRNVETLDDQGRHVAQVALFTQLSQQSPGFDRHQAFHLRSVAGSCISASCNFSSPEI
jgi:hypothetical protein